MTRATAKQSKATKPSTQASLPIAEIKADTVLLKDGTLRAVLIVSSINFALKSEDEQNALISAYVGFLNSLDFPLQIVIQSRKLQVEPYLQMLLDKEKEQQNELLKMQIADYRAFVGELIELGEIMTKRFYVVVPFDPLSNKKKGFFSRLKEVLTPATSIRVKNERFLKRKKELDLRLQRVNSGLLGMGLNAVRLDTQSLIELYYSTYNPDIAFSEPLGKTEDLRIDEPFTE